MSSINFYKEHPKTCAPDDFWGQIKRTVNGKSVAPEQIDMIVKAVKEGLEICPNDTILDLCCGNGALGINFFDLCRGGLGVDTSDFLIEVARKNFISKPEIEYQLMNVLDYVQCESTPERFTKAVCYGSFQYLLKKDAKFLLYELRTRFSGLESLFIGNLPDKNRIMNFYSEIPAKGLENDPDSPIGIWYTDAEFSELAANTGWEAQFRQMPKEYYAAHYRFDAILKPGEKY